jgi:hypothetical protein
MRVDAYVCDVCGTTRAKSNHWRLVVIDAKGFHVCDWNDSKAKNKKVKHICGQLCLHKSLDKYMAPSAPILVSEEHEEENLAMRANFS